MSAIRRHLGTVVIAMAAGAIGASMPALADGVRHALFAHNAGKVDGKHAVGAGASVQARAGKLVATKRGNGKLPNNIIAKAADANRLDGLDSTAFATTEQLAGATSDVWGYVTGTTGALAASSGNVAASRSGEGDYCLVVPERASHDATQVTLAEPGGELIVSVGPRDASTCDSSDDETHDVVSVHVRMIDGSPEDADFTVLVPLP